MTHQYKRRQETLNEEISKLSHKLNLKEDEIVQKTEEFKRMEEDFKNQKSQRETEKTELQSKIESMSAEFGTMLSKTLKKMNERIKMAQWDTSDNNEVINNLNSTDNK